MTRHSVRGTLAVLMIVVLLLGACGGSDTGSGTSTAPAATVTRAPTEQPADSAVQEDTPAATSIDATATVPVIEESTPTAGATTATEKPTAEMDVPANPTTPISADLEKALITLSDLPTGWTASPPSENTNDGPGFCNMPSINIEHPAKSKAVADFNGGALGPILSQSIADYDGDSAEAAMQSTRDAISCGSWTDQDGAEWTLTEMSFPDVGDEIIALKIATSSEGFDVGGDLVIVRDDNKIVLVTQLGIGAIDSSLTEQVVRTSLDRLD